MNEHDHQAAFFQWAAMNWQKYPELNLMYAIPNGGHRNPRTAVMLQREGVKAGVPDVHLPVARGIYHGLYMEFKVGTEKPKPHQYFWLAELRGQGYLTAVAYEWSRAVDIVINYLTEEPIPEEWLLLNFRGDGVKRVRRLDDKTDRAPKGSKRTTLKCYRRTRLTLPLTASQVEGTKQPEGQRNQAKRSRQGRGLG